MKKIFIFSAMMLTATAALAKDIKTVVLTTNPEMHCNNCEKKIKYEAKEVKNTPKKGENTPVSDKK